MNKSVLIVEDQFVEANDLQLILKKAGYNVCGIARSVPIAQEILKNEKPDFVLLDIFLKGKLTGIDLAKQLRDDNIPFIYSSANSNEDILSEAKTTEPYGFIVKPFREKDLLVTLEIAQYRHEHSRESKFRREAGLIQQLDLIINDETDWKDKLLQIGKTIQPVIPFDLLSVGSDDPEMMANNELSFLRIGFNEYQAIGLNELSTITGISADELVAIQADSGKETVSRFFNTEAFEEITQKRSIKKIFAEVFDVQSLHILPIQLPEGNIFNFNFYSRRPDAYTTDHTAILKNLQLSITRNIEQLLYVENAGKNTKPLKTQRQQITIDHSNADAPVFEGIIGNSHLLLNVFDQITQVAPYDTAVLILG